MILAAPFFMMAAPPRIVVVHDAALDAAASVVTLVGPPHRRARSCRCLTSAVNASRSTARYGRGMCRNIRTLFNFDPPATDDEIRAAALQFVRKIAGTTKPARDNAAAFERAIDEVFRASRALIDDMHPHGPARDRAVEAMKAKQRSALRFRKAEAKDGAPTPLT